MNDKESEHDELHSYDKEDKQTYSKQTDLLTVLFAAL